MRFRGLLLVLIVLPGCSKDGDTTIINQDVVPADPPTKSWRIPEMLGTANAGSASTGDVKFDAAGNAFAIFRQDGIWARRWTPVDGWGDIERVSDASPYGTGAKLTVDAAGNAIVVYHQLDDPSGGFETSTWWNRYTVGSGWGTADLLESLPMFDNDVQIAGDPLGNAIAIWGSSDGIASSDLTYNRYVVGSGWTGAAPLEGGPDIASSARLGMDSSGNAIAVWVQGTGGADSNIMSARFVPGSDWTTPAPIETSADFASGPEVSVNATGDAIAIWMQTPAALTNLWSATFRPASGWSAAALVENTSLWTVVGGLQVGTAGAGAGTAAWEAADGISSRVWTGRYSPVGGWTSIEPVSSLMNGTYAKLAVQPSGATGIAWVHLDGAIGSLVFSSHDGAGAWTPPVFVEFHDFQVDNPALAFDSAGNGIAVWSYYDNGMGFRTWANWFE